MTSLVSIGVHLWESARRKGEGSGETREKFNSDLSEELPSMLSNVGGMLTGMQHGF